MDQIELKLSDKDFARVRLRVFREAGISLSDAKRTLVVSRLYKLVRGLGLTSYAAYLDHLDRAGSAADVQDFVNALTTNLTRFFREEHHFDHLVAYVATLLDDPPRRGAGRRPRLRVWSAGCSTGQEAYTIALSLLGAFPELTDWDFRILATDIDTNVIARAQAGIYPQSEIAGLPAAQARLFEPAGEGRIAVPEKVRSHVAFKPLNLIRQWPMRGPFDAIFCRNVAIYFDKPTQRELFGRLGELLAPGGFLYIGHSENMGTGVEGFRLVGKTVYQTTKPGVRDAA